MIYQVTQPHPALLPFVKEYILIHFNFEGLAGQRPARLLEARAEQSLIFYPSGRFTKISPDQDKRLLIPPSVIQGQLLSSWFHHYPRNFKLLKIVFQPGGLFHLLGQLPTTYFTDAVINAEDVLGRENYQLLQQLMDTEQYDRMIQTTETYLLAMFRQLRLRIEPIDRVNGLVMKPYLPPSLDYLASQACLSVRQFERKFKQRNGVSPKLFLRIARFNRAFAHKQRDPTLDWLTIALGCGYGDYQHMVKDFKQFAGLTPPDLLEAQTRAPEKVLGLR
ncbi:helix-turn-helix domain-containing protein [Spirosoma koreense]